ncbi:indole-3-glycerol phosphate synthase TrpC [Hymenobacter ginsengisoli]|uniref:indole-3-glycerol-phosphate synthase n=1 Tax=Hymenobacter ginsengisoli TaxID=1051626 RepID=A0ABP8PYV3_9BACT|nr:MULTISPECIES: indole-3-glycerol phosphate synthase TrpC [unclassified Hymenobacter]MBO2030351.1 indole-3-glycerol phosphate synthase TrpC [Hymenobacter sp. BT559]
MTILDKIIAEKRQEVVRREAETSAAQLQKSPLFARPVLSARAALTAAGSSGIIAEFKRRSPSKGVINGTAEAGATTAGYVAAGAACLSVLTDEPFFGGTPADLQAARAANPGTPILRKDFVISEYQITEARALGADFILLIASCLTPAEVVQLSQFAHLLGLEVLLEVHDEAELRSHLTSSVDLVGVNNRNLSTFVTDVDTSARLASLIPDSFVKVAESGLQHASTILALRQAGYQGFLIGETFMKTPDPAAALAGLVAELSTPVSAS